MKVDITVVNEQVLLAPGNFAQAPSEVDVRVGLYNEQADFPNTPYEGQVQTVTFVHNGSQTQTVTFDVDPQTVTNGRLFYGYKIEAPALIQDEDFDEGDIYLSVEEGLRFVYLYPVNFAASQNLRYLERDGSRSLWFPPTGVAGEVITPSYWESPPTPDAPPGGHSFFPEIWGGFRSPFEPSTSDYDTPIAPQPSVGHDRVTTYMTRVFDLSTILAEDTNEFFQRVAQYDNLRLNVRPIAEAALGNEYVPGSNEKALRIIDAPDAAELHFASATLINKDSFAVNLRLERPTFNGFTLNDVNSFTELGNSTLLWWLVRFEFELEVLNPSTQEWSVYNPRIAILDGTPFNFAGEALRFTVPTEVGIAELGSVTAIDAT